MFFLKFYRRLQPGINPELEIGRYLTEVVRFPNIVPGGRRGRIREPGWHGS